MRAIRQHAFGGSDKLVLEEVPDPRPGAGQVRVAVHAAGVHLLDTVIRRGDGPERAAVTLPMTPGREIAGIVDEVGPNVDASWLGQRVVADLGIASGGYAEYARAAEAQLHPLPHQVPYDLAVAAVGTGRTAQAILELAQPGRGDVVLITAAASGVGALLVRAARVAGATVIGVARGPDKVAFIGELGADMTADYGEPDWCTRVREALGEASVTLLLDGVGGEQGGQALNLLGVGGRLVMYGTASGAPTQLAAGDIFGRGITVSAAVGARLLQRPGGLRPLEERALGALFDGSLVPVIGQIFDLADARQAHDAVENRNTLGKTVIRPAGQ